MYAFVPSMLMVAIAAGTAEVLLKDAAAEVCTKFWATFIVPVPPPPVRVEEVRSIIPSETVKWPSTSNNPFASDPAPELEQRLNDVVAPLIV